MEFREVAGRYTKIAESMDARVSGCPSADWSASTPCPDWTTRDILRHVVAVHRSTLALLDDHQSRHNEKEDQEVATAWTAVSALMRDALRNPIEATRLVTPASA